LVAARQGCCRPQPRNQHHLPLAIPAKIAREIHIAKPPVLREDSAMKPSFVVPDLQALRLAVVATGGWLKSDDMAWTIRGYTVLDGCDPEGNILQFKQKL
jgi:hypothetical protein